MIDTKPDGDDKPSDALSADEGRAAAAGTPLRGKLGIRKSPETSPDRVPAASERTKQGLRNRFNAGFKPVQQSGATRSTLAADAGPRRGPGSGRAEPRAAVGAIANANASKKRPAGPDRPRIDRGERGGRNERDEQGNRKPTCDEPGARASAAAAGVAQIEPRPDAHTLQPEGVRLSKIMAERGLCSRREADQIIERGWVSVDGRRVSQLGIRISPDAVVELAPEATARQAAQVTILLHKPVGYVSGQPEPEHVPAVTLIDAQSQFDRDVSQRFHPDHLRGLAPAGRLDIDSTGLLVLTQNGRIARQLIGDDSKVEKEYLVRVEGQLDDLGLALLNHGLELDGRKLRPAKVEWVNEDQLRFVLREGRKRQIRRMCELVGLSVVGLKRVRIGQVRLGDLPMGQWRFLREDERF